MLIYYCTTAETAPGVSITHLSCLITFHHFTISLSLLVFAGKHTCQKSCFFPAVGFLLHLLKSKMLSEFSILSLLLPNRFHIFSPKGSSSRATCLTAPQPPHAIYLLWYGSHSSFKCSLVIFFVNAEPEVTLKIDPVVYSDDNLFVHIRNCLPNRNFCLDLPKTWRRQRFCFQISCFETKKMHAN